jgi:translocation and assembly module TamB
VLSDADILTLLTIGLINSDLERSGSASIGGVLADAAYSASGLNDQMKRLLPKNEILKDAQFRVSSDYNELNGNIEPVALIETKILREQWKLRAQTSLLGSRGRKAQLQVKLKDSMDAQGQWDGDKPSAPSYGDFGGDLRLHWEAP